ncbi:helix-turn-helix domain-containing protein [Nocardia sp. NBC_01499]|uniref:helix-turn-helix domain-containing protein n=1 Tax=Nocardia sp. NBC_01499 TaxID=2903597 RepID=UPI003862F068
MGGTQDAAELGAVLRRARNDAGLSQDAVARHCLVDRTHVTHIEAGRRVPERPFWVAADIAVRAEGALVAAYDEHIRRHAPTATGLVGGGSTVPGIDVSILDLDVRVWLDMNRRDVLRFLSAVGYSLPAAALLAGLEQPAREELAYALTVRVDAAAIDRIETVLESTYQQYEAFGPRAVLTVRRGQADLVDALLTNCPDHLKPRLLAIRAKLARTLGWMAYDAGHYDEARTEYKQARDVAEEAGDPALCALVLCNWSLLETRDGKPGLGLDHAAAGRYWGQRAGDPMLMAYSTDMAAEAYTRQGERRLCLSAIEDAHNLVTSTRYSPTPSHVYDAALNAGFRSECLIKLGVAEAAVPAAAECVELFDPAFVLSRGFAEIGLGQAYCLIGETDEAARIISRTADLAIGYGSTRLASEVVDARAAVARVAPGSMSLRELDGKLTEHGLIAEPTSM